MTKGRFIHMIDIIGAAAEYVQEKNEEQKNRIIKIAENVKELYFPLVVENVKRAISEHVEEAIYYPYTLKEHVEKGVYYIKNDAIEKARQEYAGVIEHRFRDLGLFCVITAITKTKTVPRYKTAVNRALKIAEQQIKELKNATDCSVETAYYLAIQLIKDVCEVSYDVYHFDEVKKFSQFVEENAKKSMKVLELLTKEADETKRKEYYQQLDELDDEMEKTIAQHQSRVYRLNEAKSIVANIIAHLYPNADKIKEIAPSPPPEDDRLFKITQTAGLSDAIYSLPRITKRGELIDNYITQKQVYTERKHDIDLQFSALLDGLKKSPVITENHIKVFLYVLREHANTGKTRVLIDYKEFFELKGIKDTKDNRKKLRQEVKELENIEFDYRYKEGGKWHKVSNARVFMYTDTRNGKGITVTLGSWVDYLPANKTYMQIDRELFRLPVKNNKIGATTLLYKLRELNHMGKRAVAVSKILDLKEIDDSELKKRGFTYAKDLIEKDFETLEREIGLKWQYRNGLHDSRADFETDYIEFMFED
jgi:hypothetical protein